jgi:methylated-DNA-[protein]-cysteine S-methyltransferase
MTYTSYLTSDVGPIRVTASDTALLSVHFLDAKEEQEANIEEATGNDITRDTIAQLQEYFSGKRTSFELPLMPAGTDFQQQVWKELVKIPFGKTDHYSAIANKLNNPLSVRAVGAANGKNPIAIIIPCHRIIGADGSLTGYAGGLWRKEFLLNLEAAGKGVQTKLWAE